MTDFKSQLKAFVEGRISATQLEQSLDAELQRSPQRAALYARAVEAMSAQQILEKPLYDALMARLNVDAADSASPSVENEDDDRTRLQPGAAADDETQLRPPRRSALAPAVAAAEDDDQTRLAAAPMVDDDQTRIGAPPEVTQPTAQTASTTGTAQWRQPFSPTQATALAVGSVLKERFRLVEFIGCGGMGDVYKAEDSRRLDADDADPLVAVKVLNKTFREHPESLRALQREARKSQHLAHPNIINVFDFDRDQQHVFMTMELMKGQPLNDAIKGQPHGFPLDEVLTYTKGMAEALKYAHHLGVIHSDFKPSNVFVHQGVIKVFDFGIARAAKSGQDESDSFDAGELGALTPSYASPEMLDSKEWGPDPRDDIYALGCITYELLTGRHPFISGGKKVPANEACAQGLKPQRIKALSRGQWKALEQTLQFQREGRTASVQAFLDGFIPAASPQRRISRWLLWPGAALFIVGTAYLPIREQWQKRKVTEFAERLVAGDEARVAAQLAEIEAYDPVEKDRYFSDVRVKEPLTDYFIARFEQRAGEDRFDSVEALIDQAGRIYADSRRIAEQAVQMRKRQAQRLNELNAELTQLLDADFDTFVADYPTLQPLLDTIAKVDRSSLMLKDPRASVKYLEAAGQLRRQGDLAQALAMLEVAQRQFPATDGLGQAAERFERELERQRLDQRVAELQRQVVAWNDQPLVLERSGEALAALRELLELDGLNVEADRARQRMATAVDQAIQQDLIGYDWAGARQRLEQYRGVLQLRDHGRLTGIIAGAEQDHHDRLQGLAAGIAKTARSGGVGALERGETVALLSELEQLGAATPLLRQAADSIARGYLTQARIGRSQQRWEEAGMLLNGALEQAQDDALRAVLEQERAILASAQQQARQGADGAAAEGQPADAGAEIARLYQQLELLLAAPAWSDDSARQLWELLDRVESLDPLDGQLAAAREQAAARYLAASQALVAQQRPADALVLLEQGVLLIPEAQQLTAEAGRVSQQLRRQRQAQQTAGLSGLKQELEAMAATRALTPAWENQLLKQLAEYEAQKPDSEFVDKLRRQVAQAYFDQAQTRRIDNQFDAARVALDTARRFAVSLSGLESEVEAIAQAEQRHQAEQAAAHDKALAEGMKQSFMTQIAANDVRQASKTFAALSPRLNPDDPFIKRQAPDAFAAAYLRLAEQQAGKQRYQDASKLIETGRQYAPASQRLMEMQSQYQHQLKIQRFLSAARSVGADNLDVLNRTLIGFQAQVTGSRYQQLEKLLHDNLFQQIKTLERSDASAAEQLLQRARTVFPRQNRFGDYVVDRSVASRAAAIRQLKAQIDQQSLAETLDMTAQVQQLQRTLPAEDYRGLVRHTVQRTVALLQAEMARDSRTLQPLLQRAQALWPDQPAIQGLKLPATAASRAPVAANSSQRGGRACTANLAGYGARSKAVCYDMLGDQLRAPYMVVLPPQGDTQLAIGKFEVSVSDYNLYCATSKQCTSLAGDGQQPATGLTPAQIENYAQWLSENTASTYRLPSLAEWRYAANASGRKQPQDYNCRLTQGDTVLKGWSLVEVKAGKGNAWGMVNYLGNAQELVTQQGQFVAVGGHHQDNMSDCAITLSRSVDAGSDGLTGFRLIKEI